MPRLTQILVRNATVKPGKGSTHHHDGHGLSLLVKASGSRSWVLRMQHEGKRRDYALGSAHYVTLSEAREKALETRRDVMAGNDPIQGKIDARQALADLVTFEQAAYKAHPFNTDHLRNEKHKAQWINTLKEYAFPIIGAKSVSDITRDDIVSVIEPIWHSKGETAKRVMGRACKVTSWASGKGLREEGIKPLDVSAVLGPQNKKVKHHAAMVYSDIPAFLDRIEGSAQTMGRLALRFLILTAARSGEVRGATWSEIDLDKAIWTIPGERMKAGKEHLVPLCEEALALLEDASELGAYDDAGLIFPGTKNASKPISDGTLAKVLKDMGISSKIATVHGFRSSFRDWAAEKTNHQGEVVEAALAHTISNKVEAAYRRTNYLDKRRKLMDDWAVFLEGENA